MSKKVTAKAEQLLAQCPDCKDVKVRFKGDKVDRWQGCIAEFQHLPIEMCFSCQKKTVDKTVDMGINGITPFDHQASAINRFKKKNQILAHEMGLGKTLTSAFIGYGDRCLVVCPAKLKKSWVKELSLLGIESVQVIETGKDEITEADWVIASYDIAATTYEKLIEQSFDHLFLDESHYIKGKFRRFKNGKTTGVKRAIAGVTLAESMPHVILTTGTPIMNAPIELWNQLVAVGADITKEMTRLEYSKRYCGGHTKQMGRFRFWWENGATRLNELREKIQPYIDVVKKDEALNLPEKVPVEKLIEFSKEERREYKTAWKDYLAAVAKNPDLNKQDLQNILEAQTLVEGQKLEMLTSKAKVRQAIEDLESLGADEKVVIFTNWVESIEMLNQGIKDLAKKQKKEGLENIITYSTLKDENGVEKFQAGEVQVFTANIVAGGTGLNLQEHCNNAWIIDEDWNPGINKQAEDRIHRIGQNHTAFVTYYRVDESVDDRKKETNIKKRRTADKLISTN